MSGYLPPRVLQILMSLKGIFMPGTTRPNDEAILKVLRENIPHASRYEAWFDNDGTKAMLPLEAVNLFLNGSKIDIYAEQKETRDGLVSFFWSPYVSTLDTGKLQTNLNGDGRSVLAEAAPFRAGVRCRGARYISDDPEAVVGLNLVRLKRVQSAAYRAAGTYMMTTSRQPELMGVIQGHFLRTKAEVDMLLSPGTPPETAPALVAPTPPPPASPAAAAAEPPVVEPFDAIDDVEPTT